MMFGNAYLNKRIVVTGHTGFKGTWLTTWLLNLGAKICGISDCIPTKPSMFEVLSIENRIEHHFCDIRNVEVCGRIINEFRPDFIFHLAAQPIVSLSYSDPLGTITTNVLGTANILEIARHLHNPCALIVITSDKCYENVEWEWGYKETDAVGGRDIYSGSKGAAEIIFHAYQQSFFKEANDHIRMATGRAGNVIGGGDWAKDRIVVDCMKNWVNNQPVELRCPNATRPWQHVLEPLSGYLNLGWMLNTEKKLHGQSFNFGPRAEQARSVLQLLEDLSLKWGLNKEQAYKITGNIPFHEAGLLKLNCDKALFHLKWEAVLSYKECVGFVGDWYDGFYNKNEDMLAVTLSQIESYQNLAKERGLLWA